MEGSEPMVAGEARGSDNASELALLPSCLDPYYEGSPTSDDERVMMRATLEVDEDEEVLR